jgi:hypothetical protein
MKLLLSRAVQIAVSLEGRFAAEELSSFACYTETIRIFFVLNSRLKKTVIL